MMIRGGFSTMIIESGVAEKMNNAGNANMSSVTSKINEKRMFRHKINDTLPQPSLYQIIVNQRLIFVHLDEIHDAIGRWYKKYGRHQLPWRNTQDAYAIYVSEIMLQQTQVKTVKNRYYSLFINRFPTLEVLAGAPREAVLKTWQGMGYYQRAINLHRAAQELFRRQGVGCQIPNAVEELKKLPGIGENTARAIAVFAYHQPVAVMEANVRRVLSRLFALKKPSVKELFAKADMLLDRKHPFAYNQAMMDIGALLCTPKMPKCNKCPLNIICKGKKCPDRYPARLRREKISVRKKVIVMFREAEGSFFVKPRNTRFLHGLWGFAEFAQGEEICLGHRRYQTRHLKKLGTVSHSYSHFQLEAKVYLAKLRENHRGQDWKSLRSLEKLPISRVDGKVLALLKNHISAS